MIGYIRGKLIIKQPPELLIDVNGVGYEIYASMHTIYQLQDVGCEVALYTHLIVREDAQTLYGFYSQQERALFCELIKVTGIGPKIALSILSSIDSDALVHCITNNNIATLIRIPGIGRKTAERLVVEMRDKLKSKIKEGVDSPIKISKAFEGSYQMLQDAMDALVALGYKAQEATQMISRIAQTGLTSEELIRLALQEAVKK